VQKIIITGVSGFVGRHLAKELFDQGNEVIGAGLDPNFDEKLRPYVQTYVGECDLTNPESVAKLPLETADAVINLAGLAQVGSSFGKEELYMRINVGVHTGLLDRLKEIGKTSTRVVAISTGAVYDNNQPMPISESSLLIKEGSPYALSKVAMEKAVKEYEEGGMNIVIARPFNHIGPGQLGGFLLPDLADQALHKEKITVGNLNTERDYTDVRDVVKAYALLATQEVLNHDLYNICSGKSVSGEEILKNVLKECGKESLPVEIDQTRIRPNDPLRIVGDSSLLQQDTGWEPKIPIEQTISDFVALEKSV
jgi:GDP-4-dehydro-6-deoxy-D-mannose reductase